MPVWDADRWLRIIDLVRPHWKALTWIVKYARAPEAPARSAARVQAA